MTLAPVTITRRSTNLRTGRKEIWEAVTKDGAYTIERTGGVMTCDGTGVLPARTPAIRGQGKAAKRQRAGRGRCTTHGTELRPTAATADAVDFGCARHDCDYTITLPRCFAPLEWDAARGHTINIKEAC